MRTSVWLYAGLASLALLGCAEDGAPPPAATNKPSTPSSNTTADSAAANNADGQRTTVSKPAIGGGETPATGATRPDNTAVNERDRDANTVLPTDQSNAQKDLDLSAKIRQNILRNKEMSVQAQNVKIITQEDGKVTLRGPVATEAEKAQVEQIAKDAAGADKVTSELKVIPQ